jgi:hypothetical protein
VLGEQRGLSFAAVSRAPIAKIEAFKRRMQWTFPWVSSFKNDFNYDYHVTLDPDRGSTIYNYESVEFRGEMPGLSVFFSDNDIILHSYSTYFRGLDMLLPMYHLLDRTPLGRQETKGNSMHAGENSWIRHHDEYGVEGKPACCPDKTVPDKQAGSKARMLRRRWGKSVPGGPRGISSHALIDDGEMPAVHFGRLDSKPLGFRESSRMPA